MDQFKILKEIGRGGYGRALLVKSLQNNELKVVKEMNLAGMNAEARETAFHEVEILSTLKHTNIIRYRGCTKQRKNLYILMDYADGGDLASAIQKQGKNPLLVACDIYRPAAIKQLQVVGKQLNIPVFANENSKDVVHIARQAMSVAISKLNDVVILDTAGRLHIDEALMDELKNLKGAIKPHEILLVVDSMTGQDAVNVSEKFNEALGIDGVVLTKLDGDTRGGAALSVKKVIGKPIKFAATGEKLSDIEEFHPDRMAQRILGMGDILSIIEKAEETFDLEQAEKLEKQLKKKELDLDDYLVQLRQVKKMGSFSSLLKLIPGMNQIKDLKVDDKEFNKIEAIICSMTKAEKRDTRLLNASRRQRIAKGSGTTVQDINKFIKSFEMTQKMMKQMQNNKGGMKKWMKGIDENALKNFKF